MTQDPVTYGISDLAGEFGVSTRTIRFYEEKGFITPRREGQRRIYSAADRARIRLILRGKRIGLSLAESVEIIDLYDGSDAQQLDVLLARIEAQREALHQRRQDIDAMLVALDDVEALARRARSRPRRRDAA